MGHYFLDTWYKKVQICLRVRTFLTFFRIIDFRKVLDFKWIQYNHCHRLFAISQVFQVSSEIIGRLHLRETKVF